MQALTKLEVRNFLRPNGRDWIHVGATLPTVTQLAPREEGPPAWYVVMTNPRCEKRAQSGLIEKGFGVYLPQYRLEKIIPRKGTRAIINRNLFPRYLFVQAPYGSWPRITSTDGVQALVRDCGITGRPMSVSNKAIDALLDRQNDGAFDCMLDADKQPKGRAKKMEPPFSKGENVQLTAGPFASFYATVERAIAGHTVDLLVHIFGRPTPVTMDIAQIRAVC